MPRGGALRRGVLWLVAVPVAASGLELPPAEILEWPVERFEGATDYRLAEVDGREAVHARCEASASALYLEREIDLAETPVLEWWWRVEETFGDIDETTRAGDDYPARVYAVIDGGWRWWRSKAVSYVWASAQPEGASWPNAYTARVKMLALRSGEERAGEWVRERRHVAEDFERLHGSRPGAVDGIAIMTDCDDLETRAEAWYGPIRLLPE